ncbi:MAG: hypothetical protein EA397_00150 [Deltaproteobacteria bacterium]|nr:MAG: hypothetical protein EA397_00150 [Deltaproteobacteria bacterium]
MSLPIALLLLTSSPPAHAEGPASVLIEAQLPVDNDEVDVITEALWERFARHNGAPWWLHEKKIKDRFGHSQLDNAQFIVERFREHGLPDALALAAIVNALMESSLLSDRVHPVSKAAGLFQCWRNPRLSVNLPGGGAGNGTPGFDWGNGDGIDATREQMLDRERNLDRIVFELRHVENTTGKVFFGVEPGESFGGYLLERAEQGASVAELAALWGQRIERYRPNPGGSYAFRSKIAEQLFGDLAHADTSRWRKNTRAEPAPCTPPSPLLGLHLEHRVDAPLQSGWRAMQPWRLTGAGLSLWPGLEPELPPCS